MELKRYVLFRDEILEVIKPSILETHDIISFYAYGLDDIRVCIEKKNTFKTSDNILDLVEVGDLIECTYHHESSDNGEWIEKPLYYIKGISDIYFHLPVFSLEKTHKYITALFKLQPNGDYKRYEVK